MSAPASCTISGTVYGKAGTGLANAIVRLTLLAPRSSQVSFLVDSFGGLGGPDPEGGAVYGSVPVAAGAETIYTDSGGAWSFTIPQGATFGIEIPAADVEHVGVAPTASTATFESLWVSMQRWHR